MAVLAPELEGDRFAPLDPPRGGPRLRPRAGAREGGVPLIQRCGSHPASARAARPRLASARRGLRRRPR
eukprot:5110882-Pyramimonas_sp.AAC.1